MTTAVEKPVTRTEDDIFQDAVQMWRSHDPARGPLILAIGGGAASGKSRLARLLVAFFIQMLGEDAVGLLRGDYYLGRGLGLEPGDNWEGYEWLRFEATLRAIRNRIGVIVQERNWESGEVEREVVIRADVKVVIVEGPGILQDEFDGHYDGGYWVDCPAPERIRRGRARSAATPRTGGGDYGAEHFRMWPYWVDIKDGGYELKHQPKRRPVVRMVFLNDAELPEEVLVPM